MHAITGHHRPDYRDKYTKFSYSTHFPFSITKEKGQAATDAALIFRDPSTGETAGRGGILSASLTAAGIEREWWAELGGERILVKTELSVQGETERRRHVVTAPEGIEVLEGSYALGLAEDEDYERQDVPQGLAIQSARGDRQIVAISSVGYESVEVELQEGVNIVYPRAAVLVLHARTTGQPLRLTSLHFATLKPPALDEIERRMRELRDRA
jgi:hypothetical protein